MQKLVHNARCRLCHHSAAHFIILRVESKYVKLFKLLILIHLPMLLLIFQYLYRLKEASLVMLLLDLILKRTRNGIKEVNLNRLIYLYVNETYLRPSAASG